MRAAGILHHAITIVDKHQSGNRKVVASIETRRGRVGFTNRCTNIVDDLFTHSILSISHVIFHSDRNTDVDPHVLTCIERPQMCCAEREKYLSYSLAAAEIAVATIHHVAMGLKDIDPIAHDDSHDSFSEIFIEYIDAEILRRVIHQCKVVVSIFASICIFLPMKFPSEKTWGKRWHLECAAIFGPCLAREK